MAEPEVEVADAPVKRRTFRKFSFRGVDLDQLLDMGTDELVNLLPARARRRFQRGLKRKPMALIKKLHKAKKDAPVGEKLEPVRTHLFHQSIISLMASTISSSSTSSLSSPHGGGDDAVFYERNEELERELKKSLTQQLLQAHNHSKSDLD